MCLNLIHFNLPSVSNPVKATLPSYDIFRSAAVSGFASAMNHSTFALWAHALRNTTTRPTPFGCGACGKTTLHSQFCVYLRSPSISLAKVTLLRVLELSEMEQKFSICINALYAIVPSVFHSMFTFMTSYFFECFKTFCGKGFTLVNLEGRPASVQQIWVN